MSLDEPHTLTIEALPLDELTGNPRNPKLHANDTIGASINRFGMVEPVVRDDRTKLIVSGHGRVDTLRAMKARGDRPPAGVVVDNDGGWLIPVVTSWASENDLEAEAALIALNRTSEIGGWDSRQLADILSSLTDIDQLAGVGYNPADLTLLLKQIDADTQFTTDQSGAIDEFLSITGTGDEQYQVGTFRGVHVIFVNEIDCREFYRLLGRSYDATERSFGWPKSPPKNTIEDFDG